MVSGQDAPGHEDELDDVQAENRFSRQRWVGHLGLFLAGQVVLAVVGQSWPLDAIQNGIPEGTPWWNWLFGNDRENSTLLKFWSRIWCFVFAIDTLYTWITITRTGSRSKASPTG